MNDTDSIKEIYKAILRSTKDLSVKHAACPGKNCGVVIAH